MDEHVIVGRGRGAAVALLLLLLTASCEPPPPRVFLLAEPEVLSGNDPPDVVDESFTIYAGGVVESFTLALDVEGASEACPIICRTGSGALVATITSDDDPTDISFRGNVGTISLKGEGLIAPPQVLLREVSVQDGPVGSLPQLEEEVTDRVSAMPLTLGRPVDMPFADSGSRHFCSLKGVAGEKLTVTFDLGFPVDDRRVLIGTDPELGFLLGPELADFVVGPNGTLDIEMPPHRDVLLMTVEGDPRDRPAMGRLAVQRAPSAAGRLRVSARFIDPALDDPELQANGAATLASKLALGNILIHQATAGHVRITHLDVYPYRPTAVPLTDDISIKGLGPLTPEIGQYVVPGTEPGQVGGVVVAMEGLPDEPIGYFNLTRGLLSLHTGVPFEEVAGAENERCPNSFMDRCSFLCLSGNHDPFDLPDLGPASGWEKLAEHLGIQAPEPRPPSLLKRNLSYVVFPVEVTVH